MPYYIWKRNGKVVAHDYSSGVKPPPAIPITDEEAKELGIYAPPPAAAEPEAPPPTVEELQAENTKLRAQVGVLQTQQTFLEDCLLEMADVVYA